MVPAGLAAHPQNRVFSDAPAAGRIRNQRLPFLVVNTHAAESAAYHIGFRCGKAPQPGS
jgi:hypothetical protein